jgi:hypothetical protein
MDAFQQRLNGAGAPKLCSVRQKYSVPNLNGVAGLSCKGIC